MNTKKFSRRQFLQLSSTAVAGTILASCAAVPQQAGSASSMDGASGSEAVELEFFSWGGNDPTAYEQLVGMYKDNNPNVTVNISSAPGGEYYAKFSTLVAGGETPNIASFQGWEWQPFFDKGVMADISDFVATDGYWEEVFDDSIESIRVSTSRDGKRILMPMQWGTMLMFYSKPVFDAAGVDYPTNDWTMEDYLEITEKLTSGEGVNKTFGTWSNGSWFRDIHYIRATGKQEFDEIVDPKTATFNQPEIAEAIQLVAQDLVHSMGVAPSAADTEGGAVALESGNVGMKYEGAWYMPRMNSPELREAGDEVPFDVVLMPQGADGSRPHRGWSEGILLPNTDQVDAAWDVMSFLASAEGVEVYGTVTGRLPNTPALFENFWLPNIQERFGIENGANFLEAFKRSEVDVIGGISRTKFWLEAVKPIGYDALLNGSATAAEVLPAVDEALQGMLDEFWA
ncbi:MAG: extracellular solute-binding protein [Chloroflexota bacterium]